MNTDKQLLLQMPKRSDIKVPRKDMVRRLRQAYVGVPDDSPFDKHLLIWSEGDSLRAAFIPDVPETLSYGGSVYHLQQPYVGDWDALLDSGGQLVGVAVHLSPDEAIVRSGFLHRHGQLIFANGMLHIVLRPDERYNVECVQGVGTRFYSDPRGDYMFLFPQWCDWGVIAFSLASANIPDFS